VLIPGFCDSLGMQLDVKVGGFLGSNRLSGHGVFGDHEFCLGLVFSSKLIGNSGISNALSSTLKGELGALISFDGNS